ncbi:MAG TPA: hypothetical protein VE136_12610 [Anaerolineales bacterium]|nr:hypothetical protein [Anaerolineales bacterium]
MNRNSRKPFYWGGLAGYQQLEAIAQALHQVTDADEESHYLQQLLGRVNRVLAKNRTLAEDLLAAHRCLGQIADCLRYPPKPCQAQGRSASQELETDLSSQRVAWEMEDLIRQFHPTGRCQRAQIALHNALQKRWGLYAEELLFCYDIPGLPQDNLQLEALFGRLRRGQRRISGRKSTRELRDFGQAQVLFMAENETDLLRQIQRVPWVAYQQYRQLLAEAEAPRQFFRRLHHDPSRTAQTLVSQHTTRRKALAQNKTPADCSVQNGLHTN